MPRSGGQRQCAANPGEARTAPAQGTVILPSTTTSPAWSRCTTAISPGVELGARDRLDVGHVRDQHGELLGRDGFHQRAALGAGLAHGRDIGEKHLVEDGGWRDRAELGQLGGVDRAAVLARHQP